MKINIPKYIMGNPIEGSVERALAASPSRSAVTPPINPTPSPAPIIIPNPAEYVLLESKTHGTYTYPDLYVSMGKKHHNANWFDAHGLLAKEQASMLTIRQFVDFITLLKTGNAFDSAGAKVGK